MRRRRWPWVVAAASLGLFAAANLGYPSAEADLLWTGMFSSIIAAFVLVGAVLSTRVPGNLVGPVLLGSGAVLATTVAIGTLGIVAAQAGDVPVEVQAVAAHINENGFVLPIIVILIGVPLIFPEGHLLSDRWRWIVVLSGTALLAATVADVITPGPIGAQEMPNPFAMPGLTPMAEALGTFATLGAIVGFTAAVLAIVVRYRRGDEVERHQLKWLIAVALGGAIAFSIAFLVPDSDVGGVAFGVGLFALLALPLAIGIAILRYRLYDIDRIVSRTISWGLVTGALVAVFGVVVVTLQGLVAAARRRFWPSSPRARPSLSRRRRSSPSRCSSLSGAGSSEPSTAASTGPATMPTAPPTAFAERLRDEIDLDDAHHRAAGDRRRPPCDHASATVWLPVGAGDDAAPLAVGRRRVEHPVCVGLEPRLIFERRATSCVRRVRRHRRGHLRGRGCARVPANPIGWR